MSIILTEEKEEEEAAEEGGDGLLEESNELYKKVERCGWTPIDCVSLLLSSIHHTESGPPSAVR